MYSSIPGSFFAFPSFEKDQVTPPLVITSLPDFVQHLAVHFGTIYYGVHGVRRIFEFRSYVCNLYFSFDFFIDFVAIVLQTMLLILSCSAETRGISKQTRQWKRYLWKVKTC